MLHRLRVGAVAVIAAAGVAAALVVGSAPAAGAGAVARAAAGPARLNVGVEVLGFSAAGRHLSASGQVTAQLTDNRGRTTTVHSRVALMAATGGSCEVLHLFLNQLSLSLLGLNAHLDKVQLDITGRPHGGVLGSLFCKLARAHVSSASAARALTAAVRHRPQHVLRFTAHISPAVTTSAAASTTCPVLDLVVGPLQLRLLGLVVDLQRVHLNVTATRGQGALGDLFCQLADNSTTTTTTTSSTTTTATAAAAPLPPARPRE